MLDLQLHPTDQHAGQPAEGRIDELLLVVVAPRQWMGALDCPVDVIGDPSPELRLGLWALQLAEQGLAIFTDVGHACAVA
ncbi:MAG: hypothetical protein ICV69_12805 [Thermoleophilaceae bacterium]|nr:hypothetical protein [Thermoleophilaceae bacterium]